MRVVGVLDLLRGRAVHARAGERARYEPVDAVAGIRIDDGEPIGVAGAYIDRLGIEHLYVADLDAVQGGRWQETRLAELVNLGVPVWLDAGIDGVEEARRAVALGVSRVVVGLETLPSYDRLQAIVGECGDRVAFSLDVRHGEPILAANTTITPEPPETIAERAEAAGVTALIVLDLAHVGMGAGPAFDLLRRIRTAASGIELLAGGGVRDAADLQRLADEGYDGALIATALHDGRLGAADVRAAGRQPSVRR